LSIVLKSSPLAYTYCNSKANIFILKAKKRFTETLNRVLIIIDADAFGITYNNNKTLFTFET